MKRIRDHFRNLSNKLIADAAVVGGTGHAVTTGKLREDIIRNFLRPHLPRTFEMRSGLIIDSTGATNEYESGKSSQQDCLIIDTRLPTIDVGSDVETVVVAESVIGAIEIKSHLDKNELVDSLNKGLRTKSLKRFGQQEYKKGNAVIVSEPYPIFTYILAYDGIALDSITEHFLSFSYGKIDGKKHSLSELPNAICILNKGVLLMDSLLPIVIENEVRMPSLNKAKAKIRHYKRDALFAFYQRLYSDATYTRIANFDLDKYYSDNELE